MHFRTATITGTLAAALAAGACTGEPREATTPPAVSREVDRTAEQKQQRDEEISRLDQRVAKVERDYAEANQKVASGKRTPTTGLRGELKEDVTNVRRAVDDLRTTTPANWWDRHETVMKRTTRDIEEDVRRLTGDVTPVRPETTGTSGEDVSTAPFTSRRDRFVAETGTRIEAMQRALNKVEAKGARQTEVEDTQARVKKLADDVDRLRSASADDWWDVTKSRVTEYVERVEKSVGRLDDDKQ